jgi:hypothetical protein
VSDASIITFRDGQLSMRVVHPDGAVLAAALVGLGLGPLRVVRAERDRLGLKMVESASARAAPPTRTPDEATREMERPTGLLQPRTDES